MIYVRGYTYHGDTHVTVTADLTLMFTVDELSEDFLMDFLICLGSFLKATNQLIEHLSALVS